MSLDYYKQYKYGKDKDFVAKVAREYNNMFGPPMRVYKLDKVKTQVDPEANFSVVYGEGKRPEGYIYLPAIIMRLNREDVMMSQDFTLMGLNDISDLTDISVNLGHMVDMIGAAKNRHVCEIIISKGASNNASIAISNGYMIFNNETGGIKLEDYTIVSLVKYLRDIDMSVSWNGQDINASLLEEFPDISCSGQMVVCFNRDKQYDTCQDYIEGGDLVITHNNELCVVTQSYMGDSLAWNHYNYFLKLKRISVQGIHLPNNDLDLLKNYRLSMPNVGVPQNEP